DGGRQAIVHAWLATTGLDIRRRFVRRAAYGTVEPDPRQQAAQHVAAVVDLSDALVGDPRLPLPLQDGAVLQGGVLDGDAFGGSGDGPRRAVGCGDSTVTGGYRKYRVVIVGSRAQPETHGVRVAAITPGE